jgi:hypothetical protein
MENSSNFECQLTIDEIRFCENHILTYLKQKIGIMKKGDGKFVSKRNDEITPREHGCTMVPKLTDS